MNEAKLRSALLSILSERVPDGYFRGVNLRKSTKRIQIEEYCRIMSSFYLDCHPVDVIAKNSRFTKNQITAILTDFVYFPFFTHWFSENADEIDDFRITHIAAIREYMHGSAFIFAALTNSDQVKYNIEENGSVIEYCEEEDDEEEEYNEQN